MQSSSKIFLTLATLAFVQIALCAAEIQIGENGSPKKSNFFFDLAARFRKPAKDEHQAIPSPSPTQEYKSFFDRLPWKREAKKTPAVPIKESEVIDPIFEDHIAEHPSDSLGASSPQQVHHYHDEPEFLASPVSAYDEIEDDDDDDDDDEIIHLAKVSGHSSEPITFADDSWEEEDIDIPEDGAHSDSLAIKSALENEDHYGEHKHQSIGEQLDEERAEDATIDTLEHAGIHLSAKEEDKVEAEVEEAVEKAQEAGLSEDEIAHAASVAAENAVESTSGQEIPHELVEKIESEVETSISDDDDDDDDEDEHEHGNRHEHDNGHHDGHRDNEEEMARQAEIARMRAQDPSR